MNIGILEIVALQARGLAESAVRVMLTKQFAAIMPQAVSVWCKQLGHRTHYATYYGIGDPYQLLPHDLDIVFISCFTHASGLAYALAKLYRRAGALTVIGGPHARTFPTDCLRFFDIVVRDCDRELVRDIVSGHCERGTVMTTDRPVEIPLVEERVAEIETASYLRGHRYFLSIVPILSSVGCPYDCNFCVDWNTPYRVFSIDRLVRDVKFAARRFPNTIIGFQDPNFAVRFDEVIGALAELPPGERPMYIADSSLSVMRDSRIERLRDTNCVAVLAGVESWMDYSNKTGVGARMHGGAKVAAVAERFAALHRHVPYLQAGLIFGLDTDRGDDPVELSCEFMDRTPFVWPTISTPMPLAGTPMYDTLLAEGRMLPRLPFSFYFTVHLVATLKHYDPIAYFDALIRLAEHASSHRMLARRLTSASRWRVRAVHWARTQSAREDVRSYRRMRTLLATNREFLRYNRGESRTLPEHYHREMDALLGRFAPLLSRAEREPVLEPASGVIPLRRRGTASLDR
jgi:radical SAM superfamily enzyme YgiQ (UPF0313 family)